MISRAFSPPKRKSSCGKILMASATIHPEPMRRNYSFLSLQCPLNYQRQPPPNTDHSAGLWAPELHTINGRWWLLYCAETPGQGNPSHRLFLLGGPPSHEDPCSDFFSPGCQWQDLGHVQGMLRDQWAIDGTFFTLDGALYMVYAGSAPGAELATFNASHLFIARMHDPTLVATAPAVCISSPTHAWEWEGNTGINEGPEWLESPDGSWKGLIFSAGGSWCQNYKMVSLAYLGGDPLHPSSWRKGGKPLCTSARGMHGPFGPGHGNFVTLGGETLAIFHATDNPDDGWENRRARCQRVAWTKDGPFMDEHVGVCVDSVQAFSEMPSKDRKSDAKGVWKDVKAGYKKYTHGW